MSAECYSHRTKNHKVKKVVFFPKNKNIKSFDGLPVKPPPVAFCSEFCWHTWTTSRQEYLDRSQGALGTDPLGLVAA